MLVDRHLWQGGLQYRRVLSSPANQLRQAESLCGCVLSGIVGPNGAGKSTLFKMIMGQEAPDAGTLRVGDTVVPMCAAYTHTRSLCKRF